MRGYFVRMMCNLGLHVWRVVEEEADTTNEVMDWIDKHKLESEACEPGSGRLRVRFLRCHNCCLREFDGPLGKY